MNDHKSLIKLKEYTNNSELQKGIKKQVGSMIFIHGVGKGILRLEIEKYLQKKHISYADAPFSIYGTQGAIEVFL